MTLMAPHHEMSVLYEPPGMVSQPPVYPADVRGGRCHIMGYEGGTARPRWNAGQDGWWTLGRKTQSTCPLIDSLRRDPGGTITADCPPSPTGPSLWNKNVSSHTKKTSLADCVLILQMAPLQCEYCIRAGERNPRSSHIQIT